MDDYSMGYRPSHSSRSSRSRLKVAERNAGYWLEHLPNDRVAYWDFDADFSRPLPWGPQKDTSAGAIAASGLLDLAKQTKSPQRQAASMSLCRILVMRRGSR